MLFLKDIFIDDIKVNIVVERIKTFKIEGEQMALSLMALKLLLDKRLVVLDCEQCGGIPYSASGAQIPLPPSLIFDFFLFLCLF